MVSGVTGTICGKKGQCFRTIKPVITVLKVSAALWGFVRTDLAQQSYQLIEKVCVELLKKGLLSWTEDNVPVEWVHHQNWPVAHSFLHAKDCSNPQRIRVMQLPARAHDLIPIENLWGTQTRAFYTNNYHFSFTSEILDSINVCSSSIDEKFNQKLVTSIHKRCSDVISMQRAQTGYLAVLHVPFDFAYPLWVLWQQSS